jgi:hypothetical protein
VLANAQRISPSGDMELMTVFKLLIAGHVQVASTRLNAYLSTGTNLLMGLRTRQTMGICPKDIDSNPQVKVFLDKFIALDNALRSKY